MNNKLEIKYKIFDFINNSKLLSRKASFLETFSYIFEYKNIFDFSIIETGTIRGKKEEYIPGDGGSTVLWGFFCSLTNNIVHTIDLSSEAIDTAKWWTKEYSNFIKYINEDSISFLTNFNNKIDLLYLDSFDSGPGFEEKAAQHQLKEIESIYEKLKKDTMILLDDAPNDLSGGKVKYSYKYLIDKNAKKIYHKDGQALFIK